MADNQIQYVSFDCYGTLTNFRVNDVIRPRLSDRVLAEQIDAFLADFSAFRFDEVLGAWKPYSDVIHGALERCCNRWSIPFRAEDARAIYEAVPSWGPHADVPEPLAKIADRYPLVILSNAAEEQIMSNVALLGASFHMVVTAETAQAYKPRFKAFECMFDILGCGPEKFLHVSSSLRYDLMSAHDLHIGKRVFVERGHGPGNPAYECQAIGDLGGLPALLGM